MKIIFDLDGTLICSKKRLHELFCDLVQSRELSFAAYWQMKFDGYSNQNILKEKFNYTEIEVSNFVSRWMGAIESDYYLSMDTLISGVGVSINELSIANELYVCTARQSASQVKKQLQGFGVFDFFQNIFVTEQKYSKKDLLVRSGLMLGGGDWFVGDTGHDIMAGKELGVNTCAVLSGFMSRSSLIKYEPDVIISSVVSLGLEL